MSYISVEQTDTFEDYILEQITPPGSVVQSFRLVSPEEGSKKSVLLTFTPEGITIQGLMGPLGAEGFGVVSQRGASLPWFVSVEKEEELLERFYSHKEYQVEAAERDLIRLNLTVDPGLLHYPNELALELKRLGVPADLMWDVGVDYPLSDAGWICAIQKRFVELRKEVN